ncbi:MAG: fatty acid desaturase family protein [Gemmataceae bacterium]
MEQPRHDLPTLAELGPDLTRISPMQKCVTIALPFLAVAAYGLFAALGCWPLAIGCIGVFAFVSYGSTSHDLVHNNLGLSRRLNQALLSVIELLGLRSGHAYRLAHLHHHRAFPNDDDVEAAAARASLLGALLDGTTRQFRIWLWALQRSGPDRLAILAEGLGCVAIAGAAIISWAITPAPLVWVILVVLGSWTFPLLTVYLPHDAAGPDELHRSLRFRGKVTDFIFRSHFYHLEHHLYPKVPHHHWRELAERLDPFLDRAGIKPVIWGI